jgi:hypothetical protein
MLHRFLIPTGTPLILFAILSVEMQRKCDELRSDNERLDSDIAQALTKIDQLEERAKNQEEEGQHREDAFASELSETKELLQEMKQSVKVKKTMLFKNTVENAPKAIISELQ